ncbi:ATP-grasp domain-containing protein [Glycomyces artemisiae]|uniref:ATP-grasp domain-containing protein n=1 Tax=Glycomyces artemisiae TaxID=1076443 RepID=A0A2T0UPY2_9ACTN|nr:ATP-grasp domain-containing protein [Glycomyces artemisiae]PRY59992.1 hypothetical protein B0I28_103466 [Glycomyces artemisiae]
MTALLLCSDQLAPARSRRPVFAGHTPASVHTSDLDAIEDWLPGAAAELGAEAAIVEDFVKSRKDAWDTACCIPDLAGLDRAVAALGCRFVTTDLARRSDGVWRVIEVGDGQVSDFPAGADIGPLVKALTAA